MNNDMQHHLRQILRTNGAGTIFDRIVQEYQVLGEAGKQELFLAVAAELATAQATVSALGSGPIDYGLVW